MGSSDEFPAWVNSALYEAERSLHNGNAGPRRAIWSRNEPVSILGAWRNAIGQLEVGKTFAYLERTFTLRATQVYRRESGEWKVAHRHADTVEE
jgi:hypothetical protein